MLGNYKLVKDLDRGNFGRVVLASSPTDLRLVAIKAIPLNTLDSIASEMLTREITTLQHLRSPYIVSLDSTFQTDSDFCLVMDYCPGANLLDYLRSLPSSIPESTVKKWSKQLLLALAEMRAKEIVHRDFKLANVMLTDKNPSLADVKVCDFGFARFLEENSVADTMIGTPISTAPEILLGQPYDPKVDIWSFGVMVYEMLVGRNPFLAKTLPELRYLQTRPISFQGADVSPAAKALILDLLAFDPSRRPDIDEIRAHIFFADLDPPDLDISQGDTRFSPYLQDVSIEQIRDAAVNCEHTNSCLYWNLLEIARKNLKWMQSKAKISACDGCCEQETHLSMLLLQTSEIDGDIQRRLRSIPTDFVFQPNIFVEEAENQLVSAIRSKGRKETYLQSAELLLSVAEETSQKVERAISIVAYMRGNQGKMQGKTGNSTALS